MNSIQTEHIVTDDGSSTLRSKKHNALYHSSFGAVTESNHIFIKSGLAQCSQDNMHILEVGFGTGLNAALAADYANNNGLKVYYETLELYPLTKGDYRKLNYPEVLKLEAANTWKSIMDAPWDTEANISPDFTLHKRSIDFTVWKPNNRYHVVFFDAFAPNDQPEMWTRERFNTIYRAMHEKGVLTTYCVKGIVKNALREAGFDIERIAGPPGKRHILRAWK